MTDGTPRERLVELLTAQDEAAASVQLAARPAAALRLAVDGLGAVRLPVSESEARGLRQLGRPARFGRGEHTLMDTTVRNTWEVPRELVHAEWTPPGLAPDLEVVREELGLPPDSRLTAELHSLLVYEPGQFFAPHQDSEKDDAMVATLVVTLPSAHSGGELLVHHLGEATSYRGFRDRISLVAFYADCRHEVRPVTSGHRVTLTYNLLLDGDNVQLPCDQAVIDATAQALRDHVGAPPARRYGPPQEPPHRLVVLLDHEYTERGLAASRLKGDDARRVALLRTAAETAGFDSVLALADVRETRDALVDDRYDSWDERGRDADGMDDDADGPVGDLLDGEIVLTWWADSEGAGAGPITSSVSDDEVCTLMPSSRLTPYESEHTGYMGNYGNTVDRWYRRAALVAWPAELGFAIRAETSPLWAVEELAGFAHAADPAVAAGSARTLWPFWAAAVAACPRQPELLAGALTAAVAVDDAEVAATLLAPFPVETVGVRHAQALAEVRERYGARWFEGVLRAWCGETRPLQWRRDVPSREQWLTTLPSLCEALTVAGPTGVAASGNLAASAWASLVTLVRPALATPTTAGRRRLDELGAPLAALLRAARVAQRRDLLDDVLTFCREHRDDGGPWTLAALRAIGSVDGDHMGDTLARLAAGQQARLMARLAEPVRSVDDWSLTLPAGCSCQLCSTLGAYLADPGRRTHEWPLAKERRLHVHSRIDRAELPVTHHTRRKGSPYTLVLTKTPELFEREARQRRQDEADLAWLRARWPGPGVS